LAPWYGCEPWCADVGKGILSTRPKNKPLVRKAGARQRLVYSERQATFTWMV